MNNVLKKRVRLIRAMIGACEFVKDESARNVLKTIIKQIRKDESKHFLSFVTYSTVSYAKNADSKLDPTKRITATLQRYLIRNMLTPAGISISDDILNKYAIKVSQLLITKQELESKIKILTGAAIQEHYKTTPTKSCMSGDNAWKVEMYTLNPDKVSLVTFADKVRALLWTCDDGTKVLDRIYPSGCAEVTLLSEWADRSKFVRRQNPDTMGSASIEKLTDDSVRTVTVKYKASFPYLDTFRFCYKPNKNTVTLSNSSKDSTHHYVAIETDGRIPWSSKCRCSECGASHDEDDMSAYDGNMYCDRCFDRCCVICDYCGNTCYRDDSTYVESKDSNICNRCMRRYFKSCHICNEYFETDDMTCVGDNWLCQHCENEHCSSCSCCNDLFLTDDLSNIQGQSLCPSCVEEHTAECSHCNEVYHLDDLTEQNNKTYLCEDCLLELNVQKECLLEAQANILNTTTT